MKTQQFELWTQCNTGCKYCYLSSSSRAYNNPEQKIRSMQNVIDWLNDPATYDEYDQIGLIGGEFFQGQLDTPEVRAKWFEMIELIGENAELDLLNQIWISATLILGDHKDLWETLDILRPKCGSKLWIVTSYDTVGRFHTPQMLENWKKNVDYIHKNYFPTLMNVCMIMTGDWCRKIASGELDLDFFEERGCQLFMKPPYPIGDVVVKKLDTCKSDCNAFFANMYPTKEDFTKACRVVRRKWPQYMKKMIEQVNRADSLQRYNKDGSKSTNLSRSRDNTKNDGFDINKSCGHSSAYQCYIDSKDCMLCDKYAIENE